MERWLLLSNPPPALTPITFQLPVLMNSAAMIVLAAPDWLPSIREGFTNTILRGPRPLNLFREKIAAFPVYPIRLTCRSRGSGTPREPPAPPTWPGSQLLESEPGFVAGAPPFSAAG